MFSTILCACSIVGHFSPLKEDNTVVKAGDLLKMYGSCAEALVVWLAFFWNIIQSNVTVPAEILGLTLMASLLQLHTHCKFKALQQMLPSSSQQLLPEKLLMLLQLQTLPWRRHCGLCVLANISAMSQIFCARWWNPMVVI